MENEINWFKAFQKSLVENSQLVFSKKINVSVVDDGLPVNEIIDVHQILPIDDNAAILAFIDNRTSFYRSLTDNSTACLSIYFPMSREKFRLNCTFHSISGNGKSILELSNKIQFESFLRKNLKSNNAILKENESEENFINRGYEYYKKLTSQIHQFKNEKILDEYWNKLNNEEKLEYDTIHPDSIKIEEQLTDVDKFESQEEVFHSKNFSIIFFIPLDIEHTIYPMPQVVANTRKPHFESLYKPHKKIRKYIFLYNFIKWTFRELNP
jgi:hypothetical protein